MAALALAVDIGGTKIRGAVIDRAGNILVHNRLATEAARGAVQVLATTHECIADLIARVGSRDDVVGIGISSAGVIEPIKGEVVNAADQIPGWRGQQLSAIFNAQFSLPVFADNDANAALVGEVWIGKHAAQMRGAIIMLTLGTGLGGAVMVDGKLQSGRHHLTGHFGLAKMWDPFTQQLVTIEHLVSGTGLGNVYRQRDPQQRAASGGEVIARVRAGEALALEALDAWLNHLALHIHNHYWMIDPELIIIGGGVIDSRELWWSPLLKKLASMQVLSPLAVATLGNDAGVFGAARMVFDKFPAKD